MITTAIAEKGVSILSHYFKHIVDCYIYSDPRNLRTIFVGHYWKIVSWICFFFPSIFSKLPKCDEIIESVLTGTHVARNNCFNSKSISKIPREGCLSIGMSYFFLHRNPTLVFMIAMIRGPLQNISLVLHNNTPTRLHLNHNLGQEQVLAINTPSTPIPKMYSFVKSLTAGNDSNLLDTSCIYLLRLETDQITLSIISSVIQSKRHRRNILMINFQHYIQIPLSNTVFIRISYHPMFSIIIIFIIMRLQHFAMTRTWKHAEGETYSVDDHTRSNWQSTYRIEC